MIVNAEDPGFVIHEKKAEREIGCLFLEGEERKKYSYVYDHEHWTLTTDSHCYGDIVKSAYYKIAGTGKSKVEWKVNVENPGKYEVFVYVPDVEATSARKVLSGGETFYQVTSAETSRTWKYCWITRNRDGSLWGNIILIVVNIACF